MQSPLSNPPMPAAEVNRTLLKDGIANANIPALLMVLYQ